MRILITGGTGFIGSRLALQARAVGHDVQVTGMTNTAAETANERELIAAGIDILLVDLERLAADGERLRGLDALVHLAAAQHEMNVPDDHYRKVNIDGTRALLDAAANAGVGRFLYGSTIGVYGNRDGILDEATPVGPDNIYGVTKLEAEQLVLGRAGQQAVTAIRISETYGPGDHRLLKLFRAVKKGSFFLVGDGRNLHHPVYIDDLASGILLAAEHPAALGEVFVLPGKEAVTTDAMVAAVAAAVGKPMPRLRLPMGPMLTAAAATESVCRPLGIQPPLHRRRMDFFKKSFSFHATKAAARLGYAPQVGFHDGAERTARWYESTGQL